MTNMVKIDSDSGDNMTMVMIKIATTIIKMVSGDDNYDNGKMQQLLAAPQPRKNQVTVVYDNYDGDEIDTNDDDDDDFGNNYGNSGQ